jgi:hypothetical protein
MANRSFQLQVNNLVERLTALQLRVVFNGASPPTLLQGNGFGTYPAASGGFVQVASLVRQTTGVYLLQLSDAFNNLQSFDCGFSPAMTTSVADGSYVVNTPYVIQAVGNITDLITSTAPTGLISLTLNSVALTFTAPAGFTALQVDTAMQLMVTNNVAGLLAFNVTNFSALQMPVGSPATAALFSAIIVGGGTGLLIGTLSSRPPQRYTVTSSAGGGTFSSAFGFVPATSWVLAGLSPNITAATGIPFIAANVGTAGTGATVFGSIAAPAAWRMEIVDPVSPGPASIVLPQLSPSLSVANGGQLICLFRGAASALVDPDAGSVARIQLWLRNSTVKGKGE